MEYKTINQVVYACRYRVIWCCKYRREVLVDGADKRLEELIRELCAERQIDIIAMKILPDHVDLILDINPHLGVHKVVKFLKGQSSSILRHEDAFPWLKTRLPSLWTNSYLVTSVGEVSEDVVDDFLEKQKTV